MSTSADLYSGHEVKIAAHCIFDPDIEAAPNTTIFLFAEMNHAQLVFFANNTLCNATKTVQIVDGVTRDVCPPVEGLAWMYTEFTLDERLPAVSCTRGLC